MDDVSELEWIVKPKKQPFSMREAWVWQTKDECYRVYMVVDHREKKRQFGGSYKEGTSWLSVAMQTGLGNYVKYFSSIREAIEAVESFHRKKTKKEVLISNSEVICNLDLNKLEDKLEDKDMELKGKPIYGFPLAEVVGWMASEAWTVEEIRKVLDFLERKVDDNQISEWTKLALRGGKIASLKRNQQESLEEIMNSN